MTIDIRTANLDLPPAGEFHRVRYRYQSPHWQEPKEYETRGRARLDGDMLIVTRGGGAEDLLPITDLIGVWRVRYERDPTTRIGTMMTSRSGCAIERTVDLERLA